MEDAIEEAHTHHRIALKLSERVLEEARKGGAGDVRRASGILPERGNGILLVGGVVWL
jgi:hypothetical protein